MAVPGGNSPTKWQVTQSVRVGGAAYLVSCGRLGRLYNQGEAGRSKEPDDAAAIPPPLVASGAGPGSQRRRRSPGPRLSRPRQRDVLYVEGCRRARGGTGRFQEQQGD